MTPTEHPSVPSADARGDDERSRGRRDARPPTIYDVADAAGVSHQTVSRYLRGYEGIRPATRARVEQALDDLGYRPNLTARSLKSGRSLRIGALTHEISHVGPSRNAQAASIAAREAGYVLDLIFLDAHDAEAIRSSLDLLAQQDLAGILALSSTDEMTRVFESTDFRVPTLIRTESDEIGRAGASELTGVGIPKAIGHLADLGHRDFLHVAGPENWSAARNRTRAFEFEMARRGLRSSGVLAGDWSARSAFEAVAALPDPFTATAVLAANDQMALGAMLALKQRGLRIPEDVSVVGIDDIPEAAYFDPPLTTLRIDFASSGRASLQELLALIDPALATKPELPAPAELVVRASSGPAPARTPDVGEPVRTAC
ncbi:LacI family DNA-binding transcriptional regulator [Agromyces seonyuensis]|uniref:LacI family DNA-binding transcriptional regulator n=1 Tax=Agromyces seonyuensis TaxID=2662446 RepID=A0A6I4P5K9_9MICO|nr:LacI family DNA-binding transcriptional regulator [Agromyces seonyuensis]MWB99729.1 LacI family DNA-binding transcriptional regulator [Agromyces seonyuensis]